MKTVPKLEFSILILIFVLLTNCKSEKKTETYISSLKLTENLSNFTSKMTEKDTIKIYVELSMEWWIRRDKLIITKKKNKIQLQTTIKEDTTFRMKYQMRTNELPTITIVNSNNKFEAHFQNRIERTNRRKNRGLIYKMVSPNDTLIFYTISLGDKGGEVEDYFEFMRKYYPNEKDFISIEVIEEEK